MKRQHWILTVYLLLLVLGIPWYWPDNITTLVFGLPLWVFVAILVSVCASIFTAFILLSFSWNTDIDSNEE